MPKFCPSCGAPIGPPAPGTGDASVGVEEAAVKDAGDDTAARAGFDARVLRSTLDQVLAFARARPAAMAIGAGLALLVIVAIGYVVLRRTPSSADMRQAVRKDSLASGAASVQGTAHLATPPSSPPVPAASGFDRSSAWSDPGDNARTQECWKDQHLVPDCLAHYMAANGASPAALAFTDRLQAAFGRQGYMASFTAYGAIGLAEVVFPFELQAGNRTYLIVNGRPAFVDVQEIASSPSMEPHRQAIFRAMLETSPNVMVWPDPSFERRQALAAGGERLVFSYPLLDGCHACAVLGKAELAFDFDRGGKFLSASFVALDPAEAASTPARAAPARPRRPAADSSVDCVLPTGQVTRLQRSTCRDRSGVVLAN
jgi:hypothetical protein